ncbi:hypothetical protein B4N89_44805 [Embleya scabrispora]|uniref:Uncharacterized protein n=2 Tax=Embleya scabrispora TaxID=159449 RepID=A0A1T3NIR0_9ACTN|nr:hypothetical protein B4N89_44805 [Embleya scabrispora]
MPVKKSTITAAEAEKVRRHTRRLLGQGLRHADEQWALVSAGPGTGAIAGRELEETATSGREERLAPVHGLVHEHTRVTWLNARDHLEALRHELKRPTSLWAPLSLSRVAVEGLARSGYLIRDGLDLAQRLVRIAGVRLSEAMEDVRAVHAFDAPTAVATAMDGALARLVDDVRSAGMEVRYGKTGDAPFPTSVAFEGRTQQIKWPVEPEVARLVKAGMPNGPHTDSFPIYAVASGIVHSRPWTLGHQAANRSAPAVDPSLYASAAHMLLFAVSGWLRDLEAFYGHSASARRRQLDESYRESLDLLRPLIWE